MQLIFHHQLLSISSMKNSIAILIKSAKIWHLYIEIEFYMYICSFFFFHYLLLPHFRAKSFFFPLSLSLNSMLLAHIFFLLSFFFSPLSNYLYLSVNHMKVIIIVIFCLFVCSYIVYACVYFEI